MKDFLHKRRRYAGHDFSDHWYEVWCIPCVRLTATVTRTTTLSAQETARLWKDTTCLNCLKHRPKRNKR